MKKAVVGALLAFLLLCRAEDAANGAREGLCQWYYAVAPSLFPFMALMPLMTCPEANRFYDQALGGAMRALFGLPGSAAAPVVAGMIAGSPTGCIAARAVAVEEGYTRGQLQRLAFACCGLSPAFFISAIGTGMLKNAALGGVMLRSQVGAQLAMLTLGRLFFHDDRPIEATGTGGVGNPVRSVLNVAGYMTLFGAVTGALRMPAAQLALDVTAGSAFLCKTSLDIHWKLPALSALAGYGGLCVCAQNIGVLRDCGVSPVRFVLSRCLAGLMAAGFTALQLKMDGAGIPAIEVRFINISCILALLLAFPALARLRRTIF